MRKEIKNNNTKLRESNIELLRIYLLEKKYMPFVEKISKFIDKRINKFMNLKVLSKI